jgi:quinol monooxygenase YgiN
MYENATTLTFQADKVNEALNILRKDIAPVLKSARGLLQLCLVQDGAHGKITIISLWTSRAHARAAEALCVYQEEASKLDPLLSEETIHLMNEIDIVKRAYDEMILN